MTSNKRLHRLSSSYQKFICWRSQSPSLSVAVSEILASGLFRGTACYLLSQALLEKRRFSSAFSFPPIFEGHVLVGSTVASCFLQSPLSHCISTPFHTNNSYSEGYTWRFYVWLYASLPLITDLSPNFNLSVPSLFQKELSWTLDSPDQLTQFFLIL